MGRVNLLVGQNNSGKTSVLEALFLLTGISVPQLTFSINRFRGFNRDADENNLRLIFKNLNFEHPVQLAAQFDQDEYERQMNIKPHIKEDFTSEPKKVSTFDVESNSSTLQRPVINGLTVDFKINERRDYEHEEAHSAEFTYGNYSSAFLFTPGGGGEIYSPSNYIERVNSVFLTPSTQFQGLGESLERLLVEKQEETLITILRKIDSTIEDISLGANGIVYFDIGLNRLVPVNIMGDGVRRMLSIVSIANPSWH